MSQYNSYEQARDYAIEVHTNWQNLINASYNNPNLNIEQYRVDMDRLAYQGGNTNAMQQM